MSNEFLIGQETFSIVSYSTRDTPMRDLCIMTLILPQKRQNEVDLRIGG